MRAADHLGIGGKFPRPILAAGYPQRIESGDNFIRTHVTAAAGCGEPGLQSGIGRIYAQTDDVQGLRAPGHRNLDAVYQR